VGSSDVAELPSRSLARYFQSHYFFEYPLTVVPVVEGKEIVDAPTVFVFKNASAAHVFDDSGHG